tara:strand:- start:679 stop:810 length:132 start_codon:yes stop_codon:yes gene_type:complete
VSQQANQLEWEAVAPLVVQETHLVNVIASHVVQLYPFEINVRF